MNLNGEYKILQRIGEWDHSWYIGALVEAPGGSLYFGEDSGCSCYDFDDIGDIDWKPVESPHQAIELAKEHFSEPEVVAFAEALLFKP